MDSYPEKLTCFLKKKKNVNPVDSYILESGKIDLFVFQPKPHNIVGTIGVACKLKKLAHFSQNYGCLGVVAIFCLIKKHQLFHGLIIIV